MHSLVLTRSCNENEGSGREVRQTMLARVAEAFPLHDWQYLHIHHMRSGYWELQDT